MRRLVYSPKVYAFVRTDDYPLGLNISDYIVRGNVHRRTNAVSTAEIELRNPNKFFTTPGHPIFHPMDPITIFMTRLKDRPIQSFTGYLDTTPYLQLFPGTIKLTASCTLKRLLHTYWDPSLPYVFDGFLREYGWNLDPKTGQMFSEKYYTNQVTLDDTAHTLNDGSFGSLLYATMEHIGGWSDESIYIEKLPEGVVQKVTSIYNKLAEENKPIQNSITELLKGLLGTDAMGAGGGSMSDTPSTPGGAYSLKELVYLALAFGLVPGAAGIAAAVAMAESRGKADATNTNSNGTTDDGLWQINSVHKKYDRTRLLEPIYNGQAMMDLSSGGTNWHPWVTFNNDLHKPWLTEAQDIAVQASLSQDKWTLERWRDEIGNRKGNKDSGKVPQTGAAPKDTANGDDFSKGEWSLAPGANRPGASMRDPIKQFLSVLAGQTNETIIVGTGTQHDQYSTSGNQSDHWTGDAADILVGGDAQSSSSAGAKGDRIAIAALVVLGYGEAKARDMATSGALNFSQNFSWYGHRVQVGWRTQVGGNHFNHVHVGIAFDGGHIPDTIPKGGGGTDAGGSTDPNSGGATGAGGSTGASAFAAYLNLPSVLDVTEAIGLAGQKSLLNDQPLFPFVQQLCQGSLRSFQSMPNGNFFAFFPDYFGGLGHRTPYWLIDDIEIMDGGFDLSDESLATHVYIVGDINFDKQINLLDRLQSGGVMDLESALKSGFVSLGDEESTGVTHKDALRFLQKYGARPYKEELPMIRSPFFEAFLAYQKFMQLWSKQFASKFTFTFMPELYPGGIVGLQEHGVQCYIEEVIHTFDYESGFGTQAILSSPAAMKTNPASGVSFGMVRAFDFALPAGDKDKSVAK